MYGNEATIGTGGVLAATGIGTGSMILAVVAIVMVASGLIMMFVRRRKLKGNRP